MATRIDGSRAAPIAPTDTAEVDDAVPTDVGNATPAALRDGFETRSPPTIDTTPGDRASLKPLARNDNQKAPLPEVIDLQKHVNEWRAANGKPPIKEDGYFGGNTEKAVTEFQQANGLPRDGRVGVMTKNRLALENDPTFKNISDPVKTTIRAQLTSAVSDPGQIANVMTLATTPGFDKLSADHQQKMLGVVSAHRNDPDVAANLSALAKSDIFRNTNEATRAQVIAQVDTNGGDPAATANTVALATSPGFDHLGLGHQKQMLDALAASPDDATLGKRLGALAADVAFTKESDVNKTALIDTIASGPIPDANVKAALDLSKSPEFNALSPADQALVQAGVKGAKADPTYVDSVKTLLADPKFKGLSAADKTSVLSQVKNYPDARSVKNVDRLLQKDWFTNQDAADKQRSLKTVAYLSQYNGGDRSVIDNTLEKFVGAKSDFTLVWKDYKDKPGSGTTYGQGDDKTLWLNRGLIPADDNKLVENDTTRHLVLSTVPHEVNHLLNGDKVKPTYQYFEAEYRAWYVGFKSEHGRAPTNQEAMDQRISWQLNPNSFYGKYAGDALKDPKEAQKFYDLLSSMSGKKVDATNFKAVIAEDPSTWPAKAGAAPVPAGNLDNH